MTKSIPIGYVAITLALAAAAPAQERFDSADAAAQALINATANHDRARLSTIFGPAGNEILTSGNSAQDLAEQSEFSQLASAKHRLEADPRSANRMILSIGDEDWPFPVPLIRANGKWSFDASQAKVEMAARRIGVNELDAIEICSDYVDAQRKYAAENRGNDGLHEYAPQMVSSPGKHDGLNAPGETSPAIPIALAQATWEGAKVSARPYHGYYFRVLDGQGPDAPGGSHTYLVKSRLFGGFGLVAWPAQYGVTGIHTFIVNQDGLVFQKDIEPVPGGGPVAITRYNPDPSWTPVD